jgi:signal transduction histidine kinase
MVQETMPKNQGLKLARLQAEINKIAAHGDPAARIPETSDPESSKMGHAINLMLESVLRRHAQLREVAEMFQQTFWIRDERTRSIVYLSGKPLPDEEAVHPNDLETMHAMREKQRQGDSGSAQYRVVRPDGTIRWIWTRHISIAGEGGSLASTFGVLEDVTEDKEAEQILISSQDTLLRVMGSRQSQKMQTIGQLSGGIAHEINTPVQYVGDNVQFLQESFVKLQEILAKYVPAEMPDAADKAELAYLREEIPQALEQALEGVQRVARITKTLKEFSREQQDQGRKSVNVNHAIESTLLIARNALKYVADVETVYGELPIVECQLGDLNQAILDLLMRAAKVIGEMEAATGQRGLVRVETIAQGEWVTICISDTGKAISPEQSESIFEPQSEADAGDSEKPRGLALAHQIIAIQHGGTLTFTSEPGRGTTFYVRIPVNNPDAQLASSAASGQIR